MWAKIRIIEFATHDGHRYGIAVSHESHNHPSQVLPVEGAATGVGGVVRDVYCTGSRCYRNFGFIAFGILMAMGISWLAILRIML